MYQYFVDQSLEAARGQRIGIDSMIEVGSNTCLFPFAFADAGVETCHGTDIVDYSPVVDLLSEIRHKRVGFTHMADDSDATWRSLPKADLAWSYAVILHQSNPLAHLTRLASLSRKALFVMTLSQPEDWKSAEDLGIRYLSANSYYNADFPNCFDVTIVSPGLLKYSLKRLGFTHIVEIPHPKFPELDEHLRGDLDYWLHRHSFILAFREEARDAGSLNDYSISTERNPYRGNNVLVHAGFHNNIVLYESRYHIIAHGRRFDPSATDHESYSSLNSAMAHLNDLAEERVPFPIQVLSLRENNVVRFKNAFYLCPHGSQIDFNDARIVSDLHVLESLEQWEELLQVIGESGMASLGGMVVKYVSGIVVVRTPGGNYIAHQVGDASGGAEKEAVRRGLADRNARKVRAGLRIPRSFPSNESSPLVPLANVSSVSLEEVVRTISTMTLLDSMTQPSADNQILYRHSDGTILRRTLADGIQVQEASTGRVLATYEGVEEAWRAIIDR